MSNRTDLSLPTCAAFPQLPAITIQVQSEDSAAPPGFLRLVRHSLRARYPDGSLSEPFVYDQVGRKALDAVVIVAHYVHDAERCVVLRSALRPPVVLRDAAGSPVPEPAERGLWELPAGLVEADERTPSGLRRCAARELLEETGFKCAEDQFFELGPSTYPAPGVIAERHFFFHVEVDPAACGEPTLDGSALEANAVVFGVPLRTALEVCRAGGLEDAKSELALRRLQDLFADAPRGGEAALGAQQSGGL